MYFWFLNEVESPRKSCSHEGPDAGCGRGAGWCPGPGSTGKRVSSPGTNHRTSDTGKLQAEIVHPAGPDGGWLRPALPLRNVFQEKRELQTRILPECRVQIYWTEVRGNLIRGINIKIGPRPAILLIHLEESNGTPKVDERMLSPSRICGLTGKIDTVLKFRNTHCKRLYENPLETTASRGMHQGNLKCTIPNSDIFK